MREEKEEEREECNCNGVIGAVVVGKGMGMEETDPWLAADKAYHVVFCFVLTVVFYSVAFLTPYPFLRRHAISLASIASLLAGAAKEAADHLGYFRSAGASVKDAVADLLGVIIASSALSFSLGIKRSLAPPDPHLRGISLV